MKPGDVVVIGAFDEVPEHWFRVEEVLEDCVTGFAITGPLSVHDSFIIDYTHVGDLKSAMGLAARLVVGKALAIDANGFGLDEMTDDRAVVLDYQTWRETPRGEGYLDRIRRWEERKGREVVPSRVGELVAPSAL
jgi:hypothetical protein